MEGDGVRVRYRCEPHRRTSSLDWLETNGLSARKKVHELRKLFGDAIVKREDIFAGGAQLRHSTIQMTANHYTDPRQRAALPVGRLFSEKPPRPGCHKGHEKSGHNNRSSPKSTLGPREKVDVRNEVIHNDTTRLIYCWACSSMVRAWHSLMPGFSVPSLSRPTNLALHPHRDAAQKEPRFATPPR